MSNTIHHENDSHNFRERDCIIRICVFWNKKLSEDLILPRGRVLMKLFLYSLAMSSFWIFSPESLVIIGMSGGLGAGMSIILLCCFGLLVYCGLKPFMVERSLDPDHESDGNTNKQAYLSAVGIAGILGTAVFGSTGILVTAGFTFNEVFYYRFPNFGFAYLLLTIAVVLLSLSSSVRAAVVVGSVVICATGLTALTSFGLINGTVSNFQFIGEYANLLDFLSILLVFVGLERITAMLRLEVTELKKVLVILIALSGCWMVSSSLVVDPVRLSTSTIPYMIASARAAGDAGRMIMGVIIILGSLSAVWILLFIGSETVSKIGSKMASSKKTIGAALLLAVIIGILMGVGLAGSEKLEIFIRVSLILWLLHHALSVIAVSMRIKAQQPFTSGAGVVSGFIMLIVGVILYLKQDEVVTASILTGFLLAIASILVTVGNRQARGKETYSCSSKNERACS